MSGKASASVSAYLLRAREAVDRQNGSEFAALLDVTRCLGGRKAARGSDKSSVLSVLGGSSEVRQRSPTFLRNKCEGALQGLTPGYAEAVGACLACAKHLNANDPVEAYDRLVSAVVPFLDAFRAEEET